MGLNLKKLLGVQVDKVVDSIGNTIDKIVTNKEEKLTLRNELTKTLMDFNTTIVNAQKEVILAEATGNKLQRIWRPLVMLTFAAVVVLAVFMDVKLNDVPDQFWNLLKIGIGGYVAGRTLEKTTDIATSNMDISFKREKNK